MSNFKLWILINYLEIERKFPAKIDAKATPTIEQIRNMLHHTQRDTSTNFRIRKMYRKMVKQI